MLIKWRTIKGYEGRYQVSNTGLLRKTDSLKILKIQPTGRDYKSGGGYKTKSFWSKGKKHTRTVHSLVLEAFVGKRPKGYQCNHIDGNKHNNFVSNLEWMTPSQNMKHRYDVLKQKAVSGPDHCNFKKCGPANPYSKEYIITSPNGKEQKIKGLYHFCKINGLSVNTMTCIANGKRGCKSHKGWKCRHA